MRRYHADHRSVSRSPLRVLIVAVPPMRTLDVFGPAEVFGDANWLRVGDPAYEVNIISACANRVVLNHLTGVRNRSSELHGPHYPYRRDSGGTRLSARQ